MKRFLLISCLAAVGSAIFFPFFKLPNQGQSMMNVCIYSNNPSRYLPKCFMCPSTVYPNVLRACVDAAAIPSNVSYTQAACIEQNCMINRGKRSVDYTPKPYNLLEDDNRPMSPSVDNNEVAVINGEKKPNQQQQKVEIVGTEELFASDYTDFIEDEDPEELD